MGLFWRIFLLACISCICLSKAEDLDEQMLNDASAASTEGSIHGFRPCLDESCSSLSLDSGSDALTWNFLSTLVRAHKNIYQISDSETRDPDLIVDYCMPLHSSTVDRIASIQARRPDINNIRMKVLEDFIRFISDFTLLNTTDCDSSVSLISYMSLAIRSLEVEYSKHCGEQCSCVYTAGVEEYMASTSTTDSPTTLSMDESTSPSLPLGDEGYKTPCPEDPDHDSYEETYEENQDHTYGSSKLVGSIGGVPGVNFPNYTDIPLTSFSCADKKYMGGFYADVETDCQVFHVCYEHRRESFLCPLGTIFNQPILACDYWYSSNCSLAKDYYEINVKSEEEVKEEAVAIIKEIIEECDEVKAEEHSESTDEVYEAQDTKQVADDYSESTDEVQAEIDIRQFLPVKAKVIDFEKPVVKDTESTTDDQMAVQYVQEVASQIFDKIVSTATDIASKTRVVIDKVPEPEIKEPISFDSGSADLKPILSAKKLAVVKLATTVPAAKIAAIKSAIPVAKLVGAKAVVPLVAKAAMAAAVPAAKVAAVKTALPVAAKVAAVKTAIPVAAVKMAIPVAAKVAAVKMAIPVAAKVAAVKTAIPVAAKVAAVKTAIPVAAKVAAVKTAIPVAAKVAAVKTAIPVAAKVAAVKTAVPVVAAKVVPLAAKAAVASSVPVAKVALKKIPIAAKVSAVKASIPIAAKAKLLTVPAKKVAISGVKVAAAVPKLAVPVLKTKVLAPAMKGKVLKAAAVPVFKAKVLPIKGSLAGLAPVAKAKLFKAAAISPLTKKTLALGYMKLLKAKKLALMG